MSKLDSPLDLNAKICEVFGCIARANKKIVVNVGSEGKLSLFVCKNCAPKFGVKTSK